MKNFDILFKSVYSFLLIFGLLLTNYGTSWAQCGAVANYKPTVSNETICSGNTVYVYATGLPVTRWVYRDNNTGSWIAYNTNSDNINFYMSQTVPTVRTFRAIVTTASCASDTTDGVDVNVVPPSYGNNDGISLSASAYQACGGSTVTLRIMNAGTQITQWIYRDNGGSWMVYINSSSQSLNIQMPYVNINTLREFRVMVKDPATCELDSSASVAIQINPVVAGNNVNIKPILTQQQICGGSSVSLQLEWPMEIGNWLYRDGSATSWNVFSSATTTAIDYNTAVSASINRSYKVVLLNSNTCSADTSDEVSLFIQAAQRRYLLNMVPQITGSLIDVCAGSNQTFQMQGPSSRSWYYRDSATGPWTNFSNSTTASLTSNSNILNDLTREVRAVVNNASLNCSYDTSASVFYTVRANRRGITNKAIPATSLTEVCAGAQVKLQISDGTPVSYWIYRNNNTGNWVQLGSGYTYTDNNTNMSSNTQRAYRVLLNNTIQCRIDTTPAVQVLIKLPAPGGLADITPIINQPAYCVGAQVSGYISLPTGMLIGRWIYRDNKTGDWNVLSAQTNTTFYDNNTGSLNSQTIRSYRALIKNLETLRLDTSNEVHVEINPLIRGSLAVTPYSTQSDICNGNNTQLGIVPPTGYTVSNWIGRELASQNWYAFGYNSTNPSDYTSTNNPSKTYRVILYNQGMCKYDTTQSITLMVNQRVGQNNPNILPTASSNAICSGTSLQITCASLSGFSVVRWMSRDNGGDWKNLTGTSFTYTESTAGTRVLTQTNREYKVVINNNNTCTTDTSNAVTVVLSPLMNGTTSSHTPITNSTVNCSGSTLTVYLNNYSGSVQKWMYRDNGGNWSEFASSTASTYLYDNKSYVNSATNRDYRAFLVRQGTCSIDTTQILSVQLKPYGYGNAPALQPTANTVSICSGNTFNVSLVGNNIQKWIYRNNQTGPWLEISSSSSTTNFYESNTQVLANTSRSYRAITYTNGCSYDTTAAVSVQINARTKGNAGAVAITSASGIFCSTSPVGVNVISNTLPTAGSVRRWIYRDNLNGAWNEIPSSATNSYSHTNTYVPVTTTRSYRVIVDNTNACSYDSSTAYSVTINPSVRGQVSVTPLSSVSSVCNRSTTPQIYLNSGTYTGTVLKWVMSSNNGDWEDFGYTTNASSIIEYNINGSSPVNRAYRAIITNPVACSIDTSNAVNILISPLVRGNISSLQPSSTRNIWCYRTPVDIALKNISSGYTIAKWITTDNNGEWRNMFTNNNTNSTITDLNSWVAEPVSRSYRTIVNNTNTCQADTTSALTLLIQPQGSNISNRAILPTTNKTSMCSGSTVSLSVPTSSVYTVQRWTYSDNGVTGPWVNAYNSDVHAYTHNLTQVSNSVTRLYRAIISDTSSCDFDSTQAVAVIIKAISYGNDSSISISAFDTICAGTNLGLSLSPGNGNSVWKWLYAINKSNWQNFTSSTQSSSITDNTTLYPPGTIKSYTAIVLKGATCSYDTLNRVKDVFIKNKTYGISGLAAFVNSADTVCAGNTVSMSVSTSFYIERWLFSDDNKMSWQVIPSSSTSFFNHTNTAVASSTWRFYRAIVVSTSSCISDSTRMDSVFLRNYTGGLSAATPTTTNASICAGNTAGISLSVAGSTIQRWLYKDNNGEWFTHSVTSASSINDNNTYFSNVTTRQYKVILLKNCSYDTTNAVTITISPKIAGTDISKVPTATSVNVCAGSPVQSIAVTAGSGNSIVRWLSRDNNKSWTVLLNGNSNNISDYNTYVGTTVTRDYVAIINNNSTCRLDTTAKLTVTINPVVLGNNNARSPVVPLSTCMGMNYTVSMNVASDTTVIRMLYNFNGGNWIDRGYITPVTNYQFGEFAASQQNSYTMGYRAILYKAGNCRIDTTAASVITINPKTYGNDNSIVPTSQSGSNVCSGNSFNININAGSGNFVQYWLYSEDLGPWIPMYSSLSGIIQSVNTVSLVNRRYRAIISKSNSCTLDTSGEVSVYINPLIYGTDTFSSTAINGNKGVCTGSFIDVDAYGLSGVQLNTWLYRDGYSGAWNNMHRYSISITDYNTNTTNAINRQYALLIYKSASCRYDTTSINDTAFISPRMLGTDTNIMVTSNGGSYCTGTPVILGTSGLGSHTVQSWLYSNNNGPWMTLYSGSATTLTDYNTTVSAPVTRAYRIIIKNNNSCSMDSSAVKTVSINPRTIGIDNTIVPAVASTSICSGATINLSVNPGSGNSIQRWMQNTDNGGWTNLAITSATSLNDYATQTSTGFTRQYKVVVVKGAGCATDTSASVGVNVSAIGYGNQNTVVPALSNSNVCSGALVTITLGSFNGSSVKYWMYRDNPTDNWQILNITSSSWSDVNTQTSSLLVRQYRALVINSSGCSFDTTAPATVTINPIQNGVNATTAQASQLTVCSGNPVNVFINTPVGYTIQQWLFRNTGEEWQYLNAGSAASINDFNTQVSSNIIREYRTLLNNTSGCSIDSSGVVTVNINIITNGSNLAIMPASNNTSICAGTPAIINVSGFSGSVVKWLFRDSVANFWTAINDNGFTLYHTSTNVSYTKVREYRAIIFNTANCSYDTTGTLQITINPQLQGNANSVVPTSTATIYCTGNSIAVTASGFINGGVVTGWIFKDNAGSWIPIAGSANEMYTHTNTTVSAFVSRQYRALVHTGCSTDTTASLTVTIDVLPVKPVVTRNGSSDTLVCSVTAATYQWKLNGNNISGANSKNLIATQNGNYSVETGNASNCKSISDAFNFIKSGLMDLDLLNAARIYPNPSGDGHVTVSLQDIAAFRVSIEVVDVLGKVIYKGEKELNAGSFNLDLSGQSSGVYWINLRIDNSVTNKRIVINR
ncbi:MAG: T9SS type A sorting domain-containing protein [Bacteroidia bacterium]|jgi:hypothetical protein